MGSSPSGTLPAAARSSRTWGSWSRARQLGEGTWPARNHSSRHWNRGSSRGPVKVQALARTTPWGRGQSRAGRPSRAARMKLCQIRPEVLLPVAPAPPGNRTG